MKTYEFDAVMQHDLEKDFGYIEFPYDIQKEFGVKGQVKVIAYFDGFEYRGSLVKMGKPCHLIGIRKDIRKAIGKNPGDTVHCVFKQDLEERTVTVPADFKDAMTNENVREIFDELSYTHRKEYVVWIEEAKKEDTRTRRIEKAIEMLKTKG